MFYTQYKKQCQLKFYLQIQLVSFNDSTPSRSDCFCWPKTRQEKCKRHFRPNKFTFLIHFLVRVKRVNVLVYSLIYKLVLLYVASHQWSAITQVFDSAENVDFILLVQSLEQIENGTECPGTNRTVAKKPWFSHFVVDLRLDNGQDRRGMLRFHISHLLFC